MHKVKAQRSGELFVKSVLILHHFAMLDLETADCRRKLINFRKFPNSQP